MKTELDSLLRVKSPSEMKEAEIIRRLNDDKLSDDECESLLDDLACLQFADVGNVLRIPR